MNLIPLGFVLTAILWIFVGYFGKHDGQYDGSPDAPYDERRSTRVDFERSLPIVLLCMVWSFLQFALGGI